MERRRWWWAALVSLVALVGAAACNPGEEEEDDGGGGATPAESVDPQALRGTLEVWGFGTDDAIGAARVQAFERAYPNVQVRLTPGDFDPQKFLSAVAAGDPPDLVYFARNEIGSFAARGAIRPIDEFIDASGLDTGVYYESAFAQVQLDGRTYGLPEFNNVIVGFLNDAALEEAGISPEDVDFSDWEGLARINEQLSEMNGDRVARVGFDPKLPEFLPLWARANGGSILSEDGEEVTIAEPEVADTLEYGAGLRESYGGHEKYLAFSQSWDIFGDQNPFVADQLGITLFEQWYLGVLLEVSPDVEVTIVPFTSHEDGEEITYVSGNTWAIPEGAGDVQAAFEFMRFMTQADTWVTAAEASKEEIEGEGGFYIGTYTANREADQRIFQDVFEPTGRARIDQAVEMILDLQEKAFALPPNPVGAEVEQAYTDAGEKVLLGQASAEEALQTAQQEIQQALDEAG
jgi:multiple sugar transport system substrate-binding protein